MSIKLKIRKFVRYLLNLLKMGKKRIEKITRIGNDNTRKVTLCKRKKGVMKKMIELSVLCDLKIFTLIHDEASKRTTHFSSHKDFDFLPIFTQRN